MRPPKTNTPNSVILITPADEIKINKPFKSFREASGKYFRVHRACCEDMYFGAQVCLYDESGFLFAEETIA